MLFRRIFQKKPWISGRRWLLYSYTAQSPPHLTVSSRAYISQNASSSFYNATKLDYRNTSYGMTGCWFSTQSLVDLPVDGMVDVPLAQTGEGIAECELLKWFVKEGDQVEEYQPLCEVQSDKATIEITSRYKGQVSCILHTPGDIVKVGETLLKMDVGESPVPIQTTDSRENPNSVVSAISDSDDQISVLQNPNTTSRVLSTPAVRDLAKQYSVDINSVCGTGKDGRVLKEDVLKYVSTTGIIQKVCTLSGEKYQDMPASHQWDYEDKTLVLRGYQRAMVKSMSLAAKIPHFHYVEELNCDALVELKASFQKENSDPNIKHTFLPTLIKSLSTALTKHPLLNSCFKEESYEVTLKGSHNIGVAMATPNGLVVPNIKKVQSLSILEITKELSRLQQLALANKLSPEDISGGTITLSNIGAIGGKFGSPLVNVPEVCIIAIGRIQKVAGFDDDGNAYPVSVMSVNIGADHRVLDGAAVAKFCNEWKQFIEKPELLMLHSR